MQYYDYDGEWVKSVHENPAWNRKSVVTSIYLGPTPSWKWRAHRNVQYVPDKEQH